MRVPIIAALTLFILPLPAAAHRSTEPTPAEISDSLATARAQIARYRLTPPASGEDRCFDLKQIVRTLRAAQRPAAGARWEQQMHQQCVAAHRPANL
jgi:hypothetical protein